MTVRTMRVLIGYASRFGSTRDIAMRIADTVLITQLGEPDALLLFGPGEAKLQLKDRLCRSKVLSESIVAVESADKLTDPQIVAKVKNHYGIPR